MGKCPKCGYCDKCGRGNYPVYPMYPGYPGYYYQNPYYSPNTNPYPIPTVTYNTQNTAGG